MAKRKPGDNLTATFVKSITKPGTYGDGRGRHGLRLVVRARKKGGLRKTWAQRIRIDRDGEPDNLGLGSWPVVTLAEAREKALDNQRRVTRGEDIRKPAPVIPTVADMFEDLIIARVGSWKASRHVEYQWRRVLAYCKEIRSVPVSEVTEDDVIKLLRPLWRETVSTGQKVRTTLAAVMDWAIRKGHRHVANPVPTKREVNLILGKQPPKVRYKSLNHRQLGNALATVRDSDTWWAVKYCLLFLAFTCVRNCEARESTWEEIDWDTSTWTIPAERMKQDIAHQVPLSNQALAILVHVQEKTGRSQGIIFRRQYGDHYMDASRLSKFLRRLKLHFVPHGMRHSFRNWAGPRPHLAQPAAEMVLAHSQAAPIVQIYMTEDFFEYREPIMQEWGDYLCETMGAVISELPEVSTEPSREKKPNYRVKAFEVDAIGESEYEVLVQKFEQSPTLRWAVDVAAVAIMRDGLLTPQEAATARWSDLQRQKDGTGLLTIPSLKKNKPREGNPTYISAASMKALDQMQRIRLETHRVDTGATADRIFRKGVKPLRKSIKKACEAAGLKGRYSGYSPRNGMDQDLRRAGVTVNELRRAKRWRLPATLDRAERERLARHGAVANWYAEKQEEARTKET